MGLLTRVWDWFRGLRLVWKVVVVLGLLAIPGLAGAGAEKKEEEVSSSDATTTTTDAPSSSSTEDLTTPPSPASPTTTTAAPTTVAPTTTAPTTTAPRVPQFKDGTHEVGKDIQPGTYRTRNGSSGCYYARLSGLSGELDDVITNNNTGDPAVVTIKPTDRAFQATRCGTWTQDLSQITQTKTTFENGIFIVGTDLDPGTYKASASSGCYYARLSGFSGELDDVITNNNTSDAAIITVNAGDKGFVSSRCGTWVRST